MVVDDFGWGFVDEFAEGVNEEEDIVYPAGEQAGEVPQQIEREKEVNDGSPADEAQVQGDAVVVQQAPEQADEVRQMKDQPEEFARRQATGRFHQPGKTGGV